MKKILRFDYYVNKQSNKGKKLDKCFEEIKKELEQEPEILRNKIVSGYTLRFRKIEKVKVKEDSTSSHYFWIGHIEKIDTYSEAAVGTIDGERETYATGEDEGPIKDIMILFDPFNNIVSSHRTNALSYMQLNSFLKQITDDEDLELDIVVDEAVISKLEKIPGIREIEYSVATPKNWRNIASTGNNINQDLLLADKLKAGRMKVVITPQKGEFINKEVAVRKMKSLLPFAGKEVSVLKVKGNVSDTTDTLDLINGKIDSKKTIDLTRGKKVTFVIVSELIEEAYREKKNMFDYMFIQSK